MSAAFSALSFSALSYNVGSVAAGSGRKVRLPIFLAPAPDLVEVTPAPVTVKRGTTSQPVARLDLVTGAWSFETEDEEIILAVIRGYQ